MKRSTPLCILPLGLKTERRWFGLEQDAGLAAAIAIIVLTAMLAIGLNYFGVTP